MTHPRLTTPEPSLTPRFERSSVFAVTGDHSLEVRFGAGLRIVEQNLTFGRAGDLHIDEANRFLHRIMGEFEHSGGAWLLHNRGSTVPLRVFASDGVNVTIPPGGRLALGAHTGTVSFAAGPGNYELTYRQTQAPDRAERLIELDGDETAEFGVPLTPRETDFLVAFAEPVLTGSGEPAPTYAEVARQFGVKPKTVDATLQRLRKKLDDAGISHLSSTDALVTHLLSTGRITYTHLLESQSAARPTD